MFRPWLSLPLIVLGLALPTFASTSRSFVNTDIVRAIDLGGSLVQVTTTYTIKALEADSDGYTIALSPEEKKHTSWIQVKLKGEQKALALAELGYDDERRVCIHGDDLTVFLTNSSVSHIFFGSICLPH
jgi:oligosaccharyltransferase complex subunit alpha (ribophorin I)